MSGPDRLNIFHIAVPAHVGGLERVVQGLAIGLHQRGHAVTVATVVGSQVDPTPFIRRMLDAGVDVRIVRVPGRRYLLERRMIRALLLECAPDVVHTHGYRPDVLDSGIARSLSIPTVTTVHGASYMGGLSAIYEWLQERAYRRFDRVVAVSDALTADLRRIGVAEARTVVIRNAWEGSDDFLSRDRAREELAVPVGAWVVGWVGRMIEVKGGDVFLRALARMGRGRCKAVMVGDGPMGSAWRRLATDLGIDTEVVFTGSVQDARHLYKAFDAFVLSSRSEGTPVVVFEAMAAEVPIIATRVGGVPEILDDSTALLVPGEDEVALSRALDRVRREADEARSRARQARMHLERDFSKEGWISEYEDLYVELTRGRESIGMRPALPDAP